ncbi:porin family protein [Aurantibacillus circumpalustris]|uniref:porin family protein n=1 Tax=Aurantibacillus circumpalustris TaxID=3036359 RepID=UPI00295B8688|nr:porin family protein [Aurantibacillus circumpalustris]
MKKITLIAAITFAALFSAVAQDKNNTTDFRSRFTLGAKAGVNYSNVYDSKGDQFVAKSKLGFAGGLFFAIPIGKLIGIQPEILFSQKGFKATGSILDGPYILTRTTSYIDIPVFFAFKPSEFLTLLAGPQLSFLVKQKDEFKNGTTTIAQELAFQNENGRKNTLCAVLGADLTMKHFVVGVRAGWDVQSNIGSGSDLTPRYKNVWYQATIGYRFYSE